jgi:hypothetical protein
MAAEAVESETKRAGLLRGPPYLSVATESWAQAASAERLPLCVMYTLFGRGGVVLGRPSR